LKSLRTYLITFFIICLVTVSFITYSHLSITKIGNRFCYNSVDSIPHNHCALVLGTSKYLANGHRNRYYTDRIKASVKLYNSNKIDYIIVSGDNRNRNYNEPVTMYNDLIAAGVPGKKIILDYAGFRTLDSVVRCKEVFGQDKFTIVSQSFHNQRAIYLARKKGIEAIAFNSEDRTENTDLKVQMREVAARMLMQYDRMTARQPHFLGEKVVIPN